jgi:hypothetical protein
MQSHCNGLQLEQPVFRSKRSQAADRAFSFAGAYFRSACAPLAERAYHIASLWLHEVRANRITGSAGMLPNYALERPVKSLRLGAAGAQEIIAPAAPGAAVLRAAQRRR